jgi:hypothetical protein
VNKKSKKSKNNNNNNKMNAISQNTKAGARKPQTKTSGDGTILTHTETYGVNITGSADYENFATFAVQPGISQASRGLPLGQWLPQIAQNFDNYEILSLKFNFRSACSTLEPGLIVMGFEPNPEGNVPISYQEIRNMYSVDGSVHANLSFDISKLVKRPLLIRKRSVINLPSYDAGKVYIATIGCTELSKIGFVDVSYSIKLFNPQSSSTSTAIIPVTFAPAAPAQLFRVTGTSATVVNAAAACMDVTSVLFNSSFTSAGISLFTVGPYAAPAINADINGVRFVDSAAGRYQFKCNYSGRYRVQYDYNLEFQDLCLFATAVYCRAPAQSWVIGQTQTVGLIDGTDTGYLDTTPLCFRGFSGVATGDPNPATDIRADGDYEIVISVDSFLTIAIGVQSYNNVSTTTANVKFVAGKGFLASVKFTYLGPLINNDI